MTDNNPFQITPLPTDSKPSEFTDKERQNEQRRYQHQLPPPTPTSPSLPPLTSPTIFTGEQQQLPSQTASLLTPSSPQDQQSQFPAPTPTSATATVTDLSLGQTTGQAEASKLQNEPEIRNMKIRKNACVVCSICFTCAKFYGMDCHCLEVQPRRGKNLPEGGLDSRAKKLHRDDVDDYEFSIHWISENAHPIYRDHHDRVLGLQELVEVSLCKAHSSTLYRAKKRHEKNKDNNYVNAKYTATTTSTSIKLSAPLQDGQQHFPLSPSSNEQHHETEAIGILNSTSTIDAQPSQPCIAPQSQMKSSGPANGYCTTNSTTTTLQHSSSDGTACLIGMKAGNKRKRSVYHHRRTESPSRIKTDFTARTRPSQSSTYSQASPLLTNTESRNPDAINRNNLFIQQLQHIPCSTSIANNNNHTTTTHVHTIPSQQHLLDRLPSQLPPLQTPSASTSATSISSHQLQQPVPIHPYYSLKQQSPVSATALSSSTSAVSSVHTSSLSPSMIPTISIPVMHNPQPQSLDHNNAPFSSSHPFSTAAAHHQANNGYHPLPQQDNIENIAMTSPKSHGSSISTDNTHHISRPSSSHSRSGKLEEENHRIVVETVSLRPSLPSSGNATSPTTTNAAEDSLNVRYYFRNLAITHNFTFRDLLAEIDIQGSPPPPGKRIVISDPFSDRIYPLDQPIRDVITKPTSTHIELCLGLTDKPFIDWSAYS